MIRKAVLLHGQPRLTQDIDVTLDASPDALPSVLVACDRADLEPMPADVADFVNDTFVLPASAGHGISRGLHLLDDTVRSAV